MDSLHLTGIRVYGYSGALPEEQVLGQWFEVDLVITLDLSKSGRSDRLADTLDYRGVLAQVHHLVKSSRFNLIERLATAIADQILTEPQVQQVQVRLTKLAAPIPDFTGKVTVALTRTRQNLG